MIGFATKGAFNRLDLSRDLAQRTADIKQAVDDVDAEVLLESSTEDLKVSIIDEFDVVPPELLWSEAELLPTSETKADVSQDYRYNVFDRAKPAMVPATRITFAVPVTGDAKMLGGRSNPWLDGLTSDTELAGSELHVSQVWIKPEQKAIQAWWQRAQETISQQVAYIRADILGWREGLSVQVTRLIEARRERLLRDRT